MTLVKEKKGYGVLIHDTISLYARSKCSSTGTEFLLLFFILRSQCVYFIYFNFINFCGKRGSVGETGTFQRHVIFGPIRIVFFELFFLVRSLNAVEPRYLELKNNFTVYSNLLC
jgi:hypothetical protein